MRLLIVGASGYIGKELLFTGKKLHAVAGTSSQIRKDLLFLDLSDPSKFDYNLIQMTDVVVVTAAISSPDVCVKDYERSWSINVVGTSEFINRAIDRGAKIIFLSSDTVYGQKEYDVDERANCNPSGEYALMKREVEKQFSGILAFKAIRLSYVFSREDNFTRYLLDCAACGKEAEVFHPFFRAVIHLSDVVEGVIKLAQNWSSFSQTIINFGGPSILSRIEFAEILRNTVLPNLRFNLTKPNEEFFMNRPRVIRMNSPILSLILGRSARSLDIASKIEFKNLRKIR